MSIKYKIYVRTLSISCFLSPVPANIFLAVSWISPASAKDAEAFNRMPPVSSVDTRVTSASLCQHT